jgi:hypothetical protein
MEAMSKLVGVDAETVAKREAGLRSMEARDRFEKALKKLADPEQIPYHKRVPLAMITVLRLPSTVDHTKMASIRKFVESVGDEDSEDIQTFSADIHSVELQKQSAESVDIFEEDQVQTPVVDDDTKVSSTRNALA